MEPRPFYCKEVPINCWENGQFITLQSLGCKVTGSRIDRKSAYSFGQLLAETGFGLKIKWLLTSS